MEWIKIYFKRNWLYLLLYWILSLTLDLGFHKAFHFEWTDWAIFAILAMSFAWGDYFKGVFHSK